MGKIKDGIFKPCLSCGKEFQAASKYNRVCNVCHAHYDGINSSTYKVRGVNDAQLTKDFM